MEQEDEVTCHTAAKVPTEGTIAGSGGSCSAPLAAAGSSFFSSLNTTDVHPLSLLMLLLYIENMSLVQSHLLHLKQGQSVTERFFCFVFNIL